MTVRVLVTSDTHVGDAARLPESLFALATRADHIIHAGDHSSLDVVAVLERFAPVTAVHGNVDAPDVVARLPARARVELDGVAVGVVHDPGPVAGRHARLCGWFPGCGVVVYGHTHDPELAVTEDGAVHVVNPGSPTQRRRAPFESAAWLELRAGRVASLELVRLERGGDEVRFGSFPVEGR